MSEFIIRTFAFMVSEKKTSVEVVVFRPVGGIRKEEVYAFDIPGEHLSMTDEAMALVHQALSDAGVL